MKEENINKDRFKGDENPFKVPDGYFQDSRSRIMDAVAVEKDVRPVKKVNFKTNLYWLGSVAATLLIGLLLFQNLYLRPHQENKIAQEIDWFVNYAESELNSGLLASYVADEGLEVSDFFEEIDNSEQSNLIEISDIDELYIIEEMMKSENW